MKELYEYIESLKIDLLNSTLSGAMNDACRDREMYKSGGTLATSDDSDTFDTADTDSRDIEILSLLEKLGFSMDLLGTYLYKDVIAEIYETIKKDSKKSSLLIKELNNAYSDFYRFIARDDKDIGVASFHYYIVDALNKIDKDKIDYKLVNNIFDKKDLEANYGIQAFLIANYILDGYFNDIENEEVLKQSPKVKLLINTPTKKFDGRISGFMPNSFIEED